MAEQTPMEKEAMGYLRDQAESAERTFLMSQQLADAAKQQAVAENRTAAAYERIASVMEKALSIFAAMHGFPFSEKAIKRGEERL